jgi:SAM-dependent methyltransferase
VAELRIPELDFQAFLEAKAPIDSASLDPGLSTRFRRSLEADRAPRLLDVGMGTGATLRRVLALPLSGDLELAGLDRDERSLELARRCLTEQLRAQGCRVREQALEAGWLLEADSGWRRIRVRLVCGDLLGSGAAPLLGEGGFGYLTAHALLDLLPLGRALRVMHALLAPGGLLYATLNYDGSTALLPEDRDPDFERSLLAAYDASMEARRVDGEPTGGAFSGRRLGAELERAGFRVLGEGRSDWQVRSNPASGAASGAASGSAPGPSPAQQSHTALFLEALLGMIAGEGRRAAGIEAGKLEAWWDRRRADLRAGRLGLSARNLDFLARRVNRPR